MGIPAAGPERDFFLELRKHFRSIVKADVVSFAFSLNAEVDICSTSAERLSYI